MARPLIRTKAEAAAARCRRRRSPVAAEDCGGDLLLLHHLHLPRRHLPGFGDAWNWNASRPSFGAFFVLFRRSLPFFCLGLRAVRSIVWPAVAAPVNDWKLQKEQHKIRGAWDALFMMYKVYYVLSSTIILSPV